MLRMKLPFFYFFLLALCGFSPDPFDLMKVQEEILYLADSLCSLGEESLLAQRPAEAAQWFSESYSSLEILPEKSEQLARTRAHVLCKISQAHFATNPSGDYLLRASNAVNLSITECPSPDAFVHKLHILKAMGVEKTSWNEGLQLPLFSRT